MNKKREKKSYLEIIGIVIWLGIIMSMFLVAHWVGAITSNLMLSLIYIYLIKRSVDIEGDNVTLIRFAIAIVNAIVSIVWLFTKSYSIFIVLVIVGCYIGIFESVLYLIKKRKSWKKGGSILDRFLFVAWIMLMAIMSFVSFFLVQITISPHNFAYQFRNDAENVLEAPATETKKMEAGYYLTNDIQYADRYANYFFDLYTATEDFSEEKPTFIYIHGGYWVYGDKVYGDPNAEEKIGYYAIIEELLEKGFNVIVPNYALTPEFSYPTPVHQMEDLAIFLKEHGSEYGIDTEQLIYGGGGSGAQLAAQFVITQTDAAYAEKMHIEQVFSNGEIKAVYLATGLLNPAMVTDSDVFYVDFMMYQMARSYFVAGSMEQSPRAQQANIIENVTANFPATYITDGNYMTYNSQAREFTKKLDSLGVEYEFLNFNGDEYVGELIMQGYDLLPSKYSDINREKMSEFLASKVNF